MIVYSVPEPVFMAAYNYLQGKPFNEVNQILTALNSSVQRVTVPDAASITNTEEVKNDNPPTA